MNSNYTQILDIIAKNDYDVFKEICVSIAKSDPSIFLKAYRKIGTPAWAKDVANYLNSYVEGDRVKAIKILKDTFNLRLKEVLDIVRTVEVEFGVKKGYLVPLPADLVDIANKIIQAKE